MIKLIMLPALLALLIGIGLAYFSANFDSQKSFQYYKAEIEKNAENRRSTLCHKIMGLLPANPEIATQAIKDEIDEINKRQTNRWQR